MVPDLMRKQVFGPALFQRVIAPPTVANTMLKAKAAMLETTDFKNPDWTPLTSLGLQRNIIQ